MSIDYRQKARGRRKRITRSFTKDGRVFSFTIQTAIPGARLRVANATPYAIYVANQPKYARIALVNLTRDYRTFHRRAWRFIQEQVRNASLKELMRARRSRRGRTR